MGPSSGRRILAIVLGALLLVGVAVGIFVAAGGGKKKLVKVTGLSGSEKIPFFQDARVVKRLRELGFEADVQLAPSRDIATKYDLTKYDFAFPSGVPAAAEIKIRFKTLPQYSVFFTPMVVATFKPIVDILVANGVAARSNGRITLDVAKFLDLVRRNVHWTQLKKSGAYPVDKTVIVSSADVRTANSAAMYLGLASYVANGDDTVQNRTQADRVLPLVTQIFLKQGFVPSTSDQPFDDYLTIGIGKTPMVLLYEAQFVARAAAHDPAIRPGMELMYPSPTILSKHVFVPITENGDKFGQALLHDPKLEQLEIEFGFRTSTPGAFDRYMRSRGVRIPSTIVNAVDPPSYEILEYMIQRIARAYQEQ
jgi:hypothetical protein